MLVKFSDTTSAEVNLEVKSMEWDKRVERSVKTFFIFLGLSLFSIAIPIFHFILVPGFFIAAFILAYSRFKQISYLDLTNFPCPKCSQNLNEKVLYLKKTDYHTSLYCFHCRNNMRLEFNNEK